MNQIPRSLAPNKVCVYNEYKIIKQAHSIQEMCLINKINVKFMVQVPL